MIDYVVGDEELREKVWDIRVEDKMDSDHHSVVVWMKEEEERKKRRDRNRERIRRRI